MRSPVDARYGLLALGLSFAALAGCSLVPGGEARPAAPGAAALPATGPAADYPMVLGDPFTIDGQLYTPADTLNYDAVGYAGVDEGAGITVAHRTLPLPSYVQVTSLVTGKTILARVERRGPMTGSQLVALSPAAAAQLGGGEGTPVRVRRVNPPESLRAELRAGRAAPEPIETPKSLVEVLRRKLPASGAAFLGTTAPPKAQTAAGAALPLATSHPAASPVARAVGAASSPPPQHVAPNPGAPATDAGQAVTPTRKPAATAAATGFVVQAGTFSSRANAQRAAKSLGGDVSASGKYFRVRTGPFSSRGQAEAALAKVRAAGYSDARVYTAD